MSPFRIDVPYLLGLVAGLIVIAWVIVDLMIRHANPLVIPIVIGAGSVGIVVGLLIVRLVRTKIIGKGGKNTE